MEMGGQTRRVQLLARKMGNRLVPIGIVRQINGRDGHAIAIGLLRYCTMCLPLLEWCGLQMGEQVQEMVAHDASLGEKQQELGEQDAQLFETQQEMDAVTLDIGRWHATLGALPTPLLGEAYGARGREHPHY
jgi:hypothetical protein